MTDGCPRVCPGTVAASIAYHVVAGEDPWALELARR